MTTSKSFDRFVPQSDHSGKNRPGATNDAFVYYRHLASARSYVEKHQYDLVKLVDVANAIGVSPSRLSHLFREKLGMSFTEWLTRQRIDKAMEMIRLRDTSIVELAYRSGFGSYRSFHRSFKKITGTTPSEYKKNQQTQFLAYFQRNSSHT